MIIVWRGAGATFIPIAIAFLVAANVLTDGLLGNNYAQEHTWPRALAVLCAGLTSVVLGFWLNRRLAREQRDPATAETVLLRPRHDFFFVPLEYWGAALVLLGIYLGVTSH